MLCAIPCSSYARASKLLPTTWGRWATLENEAFWQAAQALVEVGQSSEEGRSLQELLAVRQGLPKPSSARLL